MLRGSSLDQDQQPDHHDANDSGLQLRSHHGITGNSSNIGADCSHPAIETLGRSEGLSSPKGSSDGRGNTRAPRAQATTGLDALGVGESDDGSEVANSEGWYDARPEEYDLSGEESLGGENKSQKNRLSPFNLAGNFAHGLMNAAVTIFGVGVGVGLILGDSFRGDSTSQSDGRIDAGDVEYGGRETNLSPGESESGRQAAREGVVVEEPRPRLSLENLPAQ